MGSADRRRDAGAGAAGREPRRRRPREFPAGAADHRPLLRADAAGDDREGSAGPAPPPPLRRSLSRSIWSSAGTDRSHDPERLRTDRGDGHRDDARSCTPDRPVTIGGPLPTYTIVILDPEKDALVAEGELGEIGIAGIGLAEGYLNRPDLTRAKFIPDFLDIPNNPSRRIYRTGDLGRINADDEIEFHGRIDTQVKVRGYRIELTEIESLLMQFPQIAQAVVNTFEPEPGAVELVAYYSLNQGAADLPPAEIAETLRSRLPGYMVPAYFEQLAVIPMTTSNKADRKNLPVPKGRASPAAAATMSPRAPETEEILAAALAKVLKIERVSIDDNFFTDLGAHSLLMARFCSDIRQTASMPDVSMRDIYLHPTIEAARREPRRGSRRGGRAARAAGRCAFRAISNITAAASLQLSFYAGFGLLAVWILVVGFEWTYAAIDNTAELYLRLVAFLIASFVVGTAIPVAAKWLLIGRWKKETFPVWSLRYFRFWAVKTLIGGSPMVVFAGTPIYNVYLRLLGAKIGRGVVIQAIRIPVATDLFSLGDNAMLSKDSRILGHKAEANYIRIGGVSIGANAFVGEASVIDIDTAMEDDTQLGHASSLQSGQRVPAGQRYHGSPAIETAANYCTVEPRNCTALRRWTYTVLLGIPGFALLAPLSIMLLYWIFPYIYNNTRSPEVYILSPDSSLLLLTVEIAVISVVLFVVFLGIGLLGVFVVPRLLRRFLQEDRTYVLYGVHYYIFQFLSAASNSRFFNLLFGDSSYIVNYLTWVGWDLGKVEQTGSNFGTGQKHDHPFFCTVGTGTIVSDGLSMSNARISNTSFKLSRVAIGERNFLGNNIQFPSDARTGANVLLGTKVMVPIDGPRTRECRPARLPSVRDSARRRAGKAIRSLQERTRPQGAHPEEERLQSESDGLVPAERLGGALHDAAASLHRRHSLSQSRRHAARAFRCADVGGGGSLLHLRRMGEHPVPGASSRRSSLSTTTISGCTSATGSFTTRPSTRCSRALHSRTSSHA